MVKISDMLRIRLSRGGKKNNPFYRVVVTESTRKRDGKTQDVIGYWNPEKDDFSCDKKKLADWVSKGAQMSDKVRDLTK